MTLISCLSRLCSQYPDCFNMLITAAREIFPRLCSRTTSLITKVLKTLLCKLFVRFYPALELKDSHDFPINTFLLHRVDYKNIDPPVNR